MNQIVTSEPSNDKPRSVLELGVTLVHLVSGEDILANTDFDAEHNVYVLSRPVVPVVQQKTDDSGNPTPGVAISLVPYRPFIKDEPLLIRGSSVVFTADPVEQMKKLYTQMTSPIAIGDPTTIKNIRG